ncbi:MAG: tRNA pseudouridine(55) synthase TruB, partial [Rhodobacteraceae bacterium]|nr:tRNA pseudouridine(55) synthase TruB [Paracoccaceae bacterium]
WSGPFDVADGIGLEEIDAKAKTPDLDPYIRPLEVALGDLPEVKCTPEGAVRLKNGNPGMVIAHNVDYGEECWASFEGTPVAIGIFKAGELHPSRVFVL